jgi:hypothetical protein
MKEAVREALKRIAENDPSFDEDEYVGAINRYHFYKYRENPIKC